MVVLIHKPRVSYKENGVSHLDPRNQTKEESMKKGMLLSVGMIGLLLLGVNGACLAGVEPSPFQPEINQLHSIELNMAAINNRLTRFNAFETLPEKAKTNYLNAMANQMQGLKTRVEEVLAVLPFENGAIGLDDAAIALHSIGIQSNGIFDNIVSRLGIEPSPFLPEFGTISHGIISQVNFSLGNKFIELGLGEITPHFTLP